MLGLLRPLLLGLSLVAVGALGSPVAAQGSDQRARELYENGARLYEEGRYEDAVAAWQESYDISERPLLLFNIANAQERLGRWRDALETLNRYRAFAPRDEQSTLDRRIANLERRLAEQGSGRDAEPQLPVQELSTTPIKAAPTPAATPRAPIPGIALLIGGGLAGGAGAGLGVAALSARTQARQSCIEDAAGWLCLESAQAHVDQDRRLSLGADIAGFTGAGVGAAGLVALIAQLAASPGATAALPVVAPLGPGAVGIQVAGRW